MADSIDDLLGRIESDPLFRHRVATQPLAVLKDLKLSREALALLDAMLDEQAVSDADAHGHAAHTARGSADANESSALQHLTDVQRRNLKAAIREMRP
jgi:hypothetical protein